MEDLGMPRILTYEEAYAAVALEPQTYQVEIDNKKTTLLNLYKRLLEKPGNLMDIYLRHPKEITLHFYRYQPNLNIWYYDRSVPIAKYGVLTRTHGTQQMHLTQDSIYPIWEIIEYFIPNVRQHIQRAQVIESKQKNMLVRAAEKLAQQENLPENIGYELSSYFSGIRPRGWRAGPSELKKINTSLFTNGQVNMNRSLKKVNTTLFTEGGKRTRKAKTRKQKRKQK